MDETDVVPETAAPRATGSPLPGLPADLSGQDLSGRDFSGADLAGTNLFRANLRGANLSQANLEGAELTGADLRGAVLENVIGTRAGMGHADLSGARLFGATLDGASLSKANLSGADLRCANLRGARIREANLTRADLTAADLESADMSLCEVGGATFDNANLCHARLRAIHGFESAGWLGVDIRDVNFAGAYRLRRFVIDQNYLKEFRESGPTARAVYWLWWITSDCGRSPLRWCACIALMVLFYAWIYTLVSVDFGRHDPDWLSAIYYSVVTITTLGYGDVVPESRVGQVVVMAQVTSGYVMLGGLLSIFANKLARRGE